MAVAAVYAPQPICGQASGTWKERHENDLVRSDPEADMKFFVAGFYFSFWVQMFW